MNNISYNGVFIAWRKIAPRTRDLSNELELKLIFLRGFPPYIYESIKLPQCLHDNINIVFLQVPQGLLLLDGVLLKKLKGYLTVADVHTGFILPDTFKLKVLNLQFRSLLKYVDLILVHNYDILNFINQKVRDKTIVVYDPPINYFNWYGGGGYIVIPSSGHVDEPIDIVINSLVKANITNKVFITGPHKPMKIKHNNLTIIYTGYLPLNKYITLVRNCDLLIAISNREYSFLRAAWEAVCTETPFLLGYTYTLRKMYSLLPDWAFMQLQDPNSITYSLQNVYKFYDELLTSIKHMRKKLVFLANKQLNILKEILSTKQT